MYLKVPKTQWQQKFLSLSKRNNYTVWCIYTRKYKGKTTITTHNERHLKKEKFKLQNVKAQFWNASPTRKLYINTKPSKVIQNIKNHNRSVNSKQFSMNKKEKQEYDLIAILMITMLDKAQMVFASEVLPWKK